MWGTPLVTEVLLESLRHQLSTHRSRHLPSRARASFVVVDVPCPPRSPCASRSRLSLSRVVEVVVFRPRTRLAVSSRQRKGFCSNIAWLSGRSRESQSSYSTTYFFERLRVHTNLAQNETKSISRPRVSDSATQCFWVRDSNKNNSSTQFDILSRRIGL